MSQFPAIRIEGGLLGPDTLEQLLAGELPGQKPRDFGLDSRRSLTDEIASVFADARARWKVFQRRLARLREDDSDTSVTRDAWVIPFLSLLGYELRYNARAHEIDGATFAISHRAGEADDAPPVHIVGVRQELGRAALTGRPRLAPHSLVQEYLNRTDHVWGLVTNGLVVRLLRDCTFVRRQAFVEFDLRQILEEQRFGDFAILYRLLHRTRLPRTAADAPDCLLEQYYRDAIEQGGRVREGLRAGVEACIKHLANGFLAHPANAGLWGMANGEVADSERSEVANSERSEVANSERSEVANSERSEVANSERSEVANSERSEVANSERSEVADSERSEVADSERSEVANSERSEVANSERAKEPFSIRHSPIRHSPIRHSPIRHSPIRHSPLAPSAAHDFYRQLLRLVYRLLFLLVSEDRGLLGRADGRPSLLQEHYGVGRLRRLLDRHSAYTDHDDIWCSLKVLWKVLSDDDLAACLGMSPLNGALFEPLDLDQYSISNRDFLEAFRHLAYYREAPSAPLRRVNYAALDVEELGSVYESLLDYHPQIDTSGRVPRFELASGSERKSTGSYYTPPELVAELLRTALEPVLEERLAEVRRMVDSEWRMVPKTIQERFAQDVFPRLSRPGGLAKSDAGSQTNLPSERGIPPLGTLRPDQPDAPGSGFDSGEHRRGLGTALHGGVHPVSPLRQRQSHRAGDTADDWRRDQPDSPGSGATDPGRTSDARQTDQQPGTQPPTEEELAIARQSTAPVIRHSPFAEAWQSTPPAIRHSLLAEHTILSLRVLDPACGSGHFLLAAARRLGKELAKIRTGKDEPDPDHVREAIRDVVAHCLYGVDKNPLAVELCRVALWLEAHCTNKPLTFLDHHIKCGDSLVGVRDLAVLETGLPDEAFVAVSADDKPAAGFLKKQNKKERHVLETGQGQLPFDPTDLLAGLQAQRQQIEAIADDSPADVRRKKNLYDDYDRDPQRRKLAEACNLWTAAFFQRLTPETAKPAAAITTQTITDHLADRRHPQAVAMAEALAVEQHFFHWPLEFPEVFGKEEASSEQRVASSELPLAIRHSLPSHSPLASEPLATPPGFDVVLSNPPWERIKLQEEEFFASRDPQIAKAPSAAARKRQIATLPTTNPNLWQEYQQALHVAESTSRFLRGSGNYPLTGRGDINTYSVFAERIRCLLSARGRAGIILPTGIATDDTNKFFFADLVEQGHLVSLFDFENREAIFPAVHRSYKFCLLTMTGGSAEASGREASSEQRGASSELPLATRHSPLASEPLASPPLATRDSRLAFFATRTEHLRDPRRVFSLTAEDIARINPNTRTLPVFRTRQDADLTHAIYERVPVLINERVANGEAANPWGVRFMTMFHMSNDSHLFRTRAELEKEGYRLVGNRFVKEGMAGGASSESRVASGELLLATRHSPLANSAARHSPLAYLPLYEAKMIWHYDHRYGTYEGADSRSGTQLPTPDEQQHADPQFVVQPWYWVPAEEVMKRLGNWQRGWLLGFRDVARSTDERTAIFSLLPKVGVGHTFPILLAHDSSVPYIPALLANLNVLTFDWVLRQKIGGTHLTFFILRQLPVLPPTAYTPADLRFIVPRVLELTYTAWDLQPFAADVWREADEALRAEIRAQWEDSQTASSEWRMVSGEWRVASGEWRVVSSNSPLATRHSPLAPFIWDDTRRAQIRAELDAYYARLYGLTRKQLRYILDPADLTERELEDILDPWEERGADSEKGEVANSEMVKEPIAIRHSPTSHSPSSHTFPGETFRVLKEKEIRQFGEYRTRRLVLEAWQRLTG